ncbi:hypothetical protein [Photobacterium galatheae]|uniref:Uncharacterized protein n=1 Tax=Photobacterium galatheae TaxID=1654360 RepID=A0A066RS57_9GAMM|nr:hypothetical protein [Photobacterium galatheae]KDM93270.1 hypothetical protein EA58_01265 [Photobacterium galatheae]MCM0150392.1 hypothetical protein [Photobacterium galatheae]
MLKIISRFVAATLWLLIAVAPALLGLLLAGPVCLLLGDLNLPVIASFTVIGLVVGAVWAERIRTGIGLSEFWGRILTNPEFDRF